MTDKQLSAAELSHVARNGDKKQRLKALKKELKARLDWFWYNQVMALLYMFMFVYTLKGKADRSKGIWKLPYYLIGYRWLFNGYLLDLWLNATIARKLFGEYHVDGTITKSLKNVKEHAPKDSEVWAFAELTCSVLNDWDTKGHC